MTASKIDKLGWWRDVLCPKDIFHCVAITKYGEAICLPGLDVHRYRICELDCYEYLGPERPKPLRKITRWVHFFKDPQKEDGYRTSVGVNNECSFHVDNQPIKSVKIEVELP